MKNIFLGFQDGHYLPSQRARAAAAAALAAARKPSSFKASFFFSLFPPPRQPSYRFLCGRGYLFRESVLVSLRPLFFKKGPVA